MLTVFLKNNASYMYVKHFANEAPICLHGNTDMYTRMYKYTTDTLWIWHREKSVVSQFFITISHMYGILRIQQQLQHSILTSQASIFWSFLVEHGFSAKVRVVSLCVIYMYIEIVVYLYYTCQICTY